MLGCRVWCLLILSVLLCAWIWSNRNRRMVGISRWDSEEWSNKHAFMPLPSFWILNHLLKGTNAFCKLVYSPINVPNMTIRPVSAWLQTSQPECVTWRTWKACPSPHFFTCLLWGPSAYIWLGQLIHLKQMDREVSHQNLLLLVTIWNYAYIARSNCHMEQ